MTTAQRPQDPSTLLSSLQNTANRLADLMDQETGTLRSMRPAHLSATLGDRQALTLEYENLGRAAAQTQIRAAGLDTAPARRAIDRLHATVRKHRLALDGVKAANDRLIGAVRDALLPAGNATYTASGTVAAPPRAATASAIRLDKRL